VNAGSTLSTEKSPRADIFKAGLSLELFVPSFEVEPSKVKNITNASWFGERVFRVCKKHDSAETIFERKAGFVLVKRLIDDFDFSHVFSVLEP
jgi:hypothetical protein